MKRRALILVLILVILCLSGCVVISCEERSPLRDTALAYAETIDQLEETVAHF